jgi:hypothetical protein
MSIKVYDDVFDPHWINQLSFDLLNSSWDLDNVACRKGWPYNQMGTHRILGNLFFSQKGMGSNVNLGNTFINAYNQHIRYVIGQPNLNLDSITGNCQFKGMDGTFHKDGEDTDHSIVLMLYYPEKQVTGGEFIYQPTNKKISFKQGRLIHFIASHKHRANAFNEKDIPRFSIKWIATETKK